MIQETNKNIVNFCKKCDSLLYLKKRDVGVNILEHYCRNCNYTEEYGNSVRCIMKTNYGDSDTQLKINKYTIKDPSLPRLDRKCINSGCLTNNYTDNTIITHEIFNDSILEEIKQLLGITNDTNNTELFEVKEYGHTNVIQFKNSEHFEKVSSDHKFMESKNLEKLTETRREIVYLKYNSDDMQYLYICSSCKTSWFNFN